MNPTWWLTTLLAVALVQASPGDNLDEFEECMGQCHHSVCRQNPDYRADHPEWPYNPEWQFTPGPLPWHLQMFGWDCESNCDYECQQLITRDLIAKGDEVLQFHGKWPFWRVFGIQELALAVLSMGNFYVHFQGFRLLRQAQKQYAAPGYLYYNVLGCALITMAAWIFSTVFHIRDTITTEKFDYYFAGLTVLALAHAIGARLFRLYRPGNWAARYLWLGACVAAFASHIYRLETDWSYTYNMQANIAVGVIQNVLMCLLIFQTYSEYYYFEQDEAQEPPIKRTHVPRLDSHKKYISNTRTILSSFYSRLAKLYLLYPGFLAAIVAFGILFEVFDFAPICWDLVDAHALWHLITIIPVWYGWYNWMVWDINENVWMDLCRQATKKSV